MSKLQEKAITLLGDATTVTLSATAANALYTVSATKTLIPVYIIADNFSAVPTTGSLDFGSSTGSWATTQSVTGVSATTQCMCFHKTATETAPVFVGATSFNAFAGSTATDCTCRVRLFGFEV